MDSSNFVKQVDEVTFTGAEGLKSGKKLFYITNVRVFKLTKEGLMLTRVMPGLDIEKDIINGCEATIILPPGNKVPVVDASIFDNNKFIIRWE